MKKRIKFVLSALTLGLAMNSFAKDELVVFSLPNLSSPFEVQLQKVAVETSKKLESNCKY